MQLIEGAIMERANYHVFGMGTNLDDLHYIGWTAKSPSKEKEQIFSDLAKSSSQHLVSWLKEALRCGEVSIFEIEATPSMEDAKDSAMFWCHYYHSLGLDVVTD